MSKEEEKELEKFLKGERRLIKKVLQELSDKRTPEVCKDPRLQIIPQQLN